MKTKKKAKPIVGLQREKLLVGLQMYDIVDGLNRAMQARKLEVRLDYTHPFPYLDVRMPGTAWERWMTLNHRTKTCLVTAPYNPDLRAAVVDMHTRMTDLDCSLSLTADSPRNKKKRALFQVYVGGARTIALTLLDVNRGESKIDRIFETPDKAQ